MDLERTYRGIGLEEYVYREIIFYADINSWMQIVYICEIFVEFGVIKYLSLFFFRLCKL